MTESVAIVVASYNTRRLIAQLVFSLYRLLGRDQFSDLVVVDNASTDGSQELLAALHRARLIHLIQNRMQRYHGPALTQGVSWLVGARTHYVWVLDSDLVVLRADTVRDALATARRLDAAAVGQRLGDDAYDSLLKSNRAMLDPCSLILDLRRIWRDPPFVEDGAPATALQVEADARGLHLAAFPFVEEGYLLHLGRGTLREVARRGDTGNRYYEWALDHQEPHFGGNQHGKEHYREFCELFDREVGELTPESLVQAVSTGDPGPRAGTTRSDPRIR
jgi:glycosyltransferase involved in cell wall biosynthesis